MKRKGLLRRQRAPPSATFPVPCFASHHLASAQDSLTESKIKEHGMTEMIMGDPRGNGFDVAETKTRRP